MQIFGGQTRCITGNVEMVNEIRNKRGFFGQNKTEIDQFEIINQG